MATVSIQLYTLRFALASDRDATLAAVAAMGVEEVEPFGIENFDWLPDALAAHGLLAGSAHAMLLAEPEKVLAAATALGVGTVFQPVWMPEKWQDAADIRELADGLNAQVDRFAAAGLKIGYHNHDWEFAAPEVDGVAAYDYFVSLLDERIVLEVDTYWATAGGRDVPALLAQYGDRITHLHIKDGPLQPAGSGAINVVLGKGLMDLPPILDASPNRTWVVEFDDATDAVAEVAESVAVLRARS